MSYLVLHIDIDFIAGAVCADNGTSYPITNEKEDLLWLYFFNNPHQNSISFGKDNKRHFNNDEINYYGRFFEKIEKGQETFTLRGIEYPVIDLLKASGLLDNIRKTYRQKTLDSTDSIPSLLTFSSSISDNTKQKTVDYLKNQGFQIDSYTIPIAELTAYYALKQMNFNLTNGSSAIFLEAINSTLHLMKLSFSDNYFLMDGKLQSWRGKGLDPRKRALVRFVVNEVNNATGVLSNEDEKEDECERLEIHADEWLRRLDAQKHKMPLRIAAISFSKAPNMKKDVMVRKDDLDSDTGQYTQGLKDIFEAFKTDNVKGDVAAVLLLGNCFRSDRVRSSFEQMLGAGKLYFYANKDIHEILAMYPKIDINRYSSEEARIRARAEAEELKQAEQRALEDKQRKEAEADIKRKEAEQKSIENKKEAKKLFDKAVELDKEGKLQDARVNVENALSLDSTNKEYKQFLSDLVEKIEKRNAKNELYKSYLKKADSLLENNKLEKALEEYEAAKIVFDNADIIQKIIEVKRLIKNREEQKAKIDQLVFEAKNLIQNKEFQNAKKIINEIFSIDKSNAEINKLSVEIEQILKEQEKQFNDMVKSADNYFKSADKYSNSVHFEEAKTAYEEALKIKPNDEYCSKQIIAIQERKEQIKKERQQKKLESAFNELMLEATTAQKKGKLKDALEYLNKALQLKPNNATLKAHINKIKFELEFDTDNISTSAPVPKDDDFSGGKTGKSTDKTDDDFIVTKPEKTIKQEIKNQAKCDKITTTANKLFENGKWRKAKLQYARALDLCPQNSILQGKIVECNDRIKVEENAFNQLLADSMLAEKEGKLEEASALYDKAVNLMPYAELKEHLKKMTFEEECFLDDAKKPKENPKTPDDDFLRGKTDKSINKTDDDFIIKKPEKTMDDDDFLGGKTGKSTNKTDDDFIVKKPEKTMDDDDFLNYKKRN